jgi:hypothetical protein
VNSPSRAEGPKGSSKPFRGSCRYSRAKLNPPKFGMSLLAIGRRPE